MARKLLKQDENGRDFTLYSAETGNVVSDDHVYIVPQFAHVHVVKTNATVAIEYSGDETNWEVANADVDGLYRMDGGIWVRGSITANTGSVTVTITTPGT